MEYMRFNLEARLREWERKLLSGTVLPPHAVDAAVARNASDEGDAPLLRKFVQDTVAPGWIRSRLDTIRLRLLHDDFDGAAFRLDRLDGDIDAVKSMIANTVPVVNHVAEPQFEVGASVTVGGKVGHERAHGTDEEKEEKWLKICAAYDAHRAKNKRKMEAYRAAAKDCRVSDRTVVRAVERRDDKAK